MKTLEQIKHDYAIDLGYDDWEALMIEVCYFSNEEFFEHENEVMKIYAMECLKLASENVKMKMKEDVLYLSMLDNWTEIDKESITNENNIIK